MGSLREELEGTKWHLLPCMAILKDLIAKDWQKILSIGYCRSKDFCSVRGVFMFKIFFVGNVL